MRARELVCRHILTTAALALLGPLDSAHAARFKTLYSFAGGNDGSGPSAGLVLDSAGNLYGTTEFGGGYGAYGDGTVFRIAPDGSETVLHAFTGSDGVKPYAGLYRDRKGNLYGTALGGGSFGTGTVFKLATNGKVTVLHAFSGDALDGTSPYGTLITDGAGNFYGTTYGGGADSGGTIFKLAPDGTETILHSFAAKTDGGLPYAGVIRDGAGNLYGTTPQYGPNSAGTVYRLAPDGSFTVLYSFPEADNLAPYGGLKLDKAGNLYGTTFLVAGSVFKLAPDGTETTLYTFDGAGDGGFPQAGVIGSRTGALLYGTNSGGSYDSGTVFRLKNGVETVLHGFTGGSDGGAPLDPLVQDSQGNLYGTTSEGGAYGDGTVFEFSDK